MLMICNVNTSWGIPSGLILQNVFIHFMTLNGRVTYTGYHHSPHCIVNATDSAVKPSSHPALLQDHSIFYLLTFVAVYVVFLSVIFKNDC